MSVSLFTSTEACKIANSLPEKFARSVWYSYVSNVTAYNLQYEEKELIDFDGWNSDEKFTDPEKLTNELGSLLYNIYTNDGNYFMPEKNRLQIEKKYNEMKEKSDYFNEDKASSIHY